MEHTHCFSHHGEGGHYYIDTTPDTVEYLGYFMPAEFVYRIDRPSETHEIGRDWNMTQLDSQINVRKSYLFDVDYLTESMIDDQLQSILLYAFF